MPVPVIGEASLDLEVLPREEQIKCLSAGGGLDFTVRLVLGLEDGGLSGVGHADRAAKVI